jgi:hypothetical protein
MKILAVILTVTVPTVLAAKAKPDWQKGSGNRPAGQTGQWKC